MSFPITNIYFLLILAIGHGSSVSISVCIRNAYNKLKMKNIVALATGARRKRFTRCVEEQRPGKTMAILKSDIEAGNEDQRLLRGVRK